MKELSNEQIEKIVSLLEKGKPLPEHYKEALISDLKKLKHSLLFDIKKVYKYICCFYVKEY
jgi:mRNA-degrading endonuclease YafQ of YafQ-DinJ toxin-antitoxin module